MQKASFYFFLLPLLQVLCCTLVFSQNKKPLDLETAILKGSSDLAPDDIKGIKWIGKTLFTQNGEAGVLEIRDSKGELIESISPRDLNSELSDWNVDSLKSVRPLDWKDSDLFYFLHQNGLYSYKRSDKNLTKISHHPKDAKNLSLSPSSGHLAYTLGNDVYVATLVNPKIPVTNHGEGEVSAGIAIHRSEFGISKGLFWSEDGNKLGFYEMDESMVTDYPLAHYTTIPGVASPIKYPMAGQATHLPKVGVFDVSSAKTVYLKTQSPKNYYLTNFTFLADNEKVCLVEVNRDQNEAILKVYNSKDGSLDRILLKEKHPKYVEPESPPLFLPDGRFLWLSERDGYNHFYLYSAEGELIKQLSKGDFEVQDVVSVHSESKNIVFMASDGLMNSAVYHLTIPGGKLTKLDGREGRYRAYGEDDTNLILKYTSKDFGNEVIVVSPNGKKIATLLSEETPPLMDFQAGDIEFPVIEAEDGTLLQSRLIKPFDYDSTAKYPVLVYVYGGPHVQLVKNDYHGGAPFWMYHAANRGYLVFTIDTRGSAGRGLEFEQATYRNMGEVELKDQLSGVEYLAGLSFADTSKMAIHGWSYGGYMTSSMMLKYPDVFDVGVAGGPVTDWNLYEIMYTERYMDTPDQNPQGYKRADLKRFAKDLEGELLIIHGLDDDVVVPQHSYNLLEAFVDAGKQVDFFVYPGYKHNVRGKDRVHLMTKVLDYIDLHLGICD